MSDVNPSQKPDDDKTTDEQALERERYEVLKGLIDWLETPMLLLAFVWLALLVLELIWGESVWFETFGTLIWIVFILDFVLEFIIAPRKLDYLRANWLTAVALLIPAVRLFRAFRGLRLLRLARVGRGMRLLRVLTSLNRGMRALGASLNRRAFGYVLALTVMVTFAGAAGMYSFENENSDGHGLHSYGDALWWTAMVMTTMGSEYWPQSPEGRVLCFLLSVYALAILGYVAATLATFFIGHDARHDETELAGSGSRAALQAEIAALRDEIKVLSRRFEAE
jgi:voltage-gated potassium channel